MSETEEIKIDEESVEEERATKREGISTEELKVKGEELVETIKRLASEAGVRRMVIMTKDGKTLLEIPLVLGVAGVLLLPTWSALALVAALVTECRILVERATKESDKDPVSD